MGCGASAKKGGDVVPVGPTYVGDEVEARVNPGKNNKVQESLNRARAGCKAEYACHDLDQNGVVNMQEWRSVAASVFKLQDATLTGAALDAEVDKVVKTFKAADSNHDGVLTFKEYEKDFFRLTGAMDVDMRCQMLDSLSEFFEDAVATYNTAKKEAA